jgi:exodeoxyribonuclease V alpha subunit
MKDSQMLEPAELLIELQRWSDAGWLRRLDRAFAAFMLDLSPQCEAPVLLAAALLAHMEGRGHSCLALDELLANPAELLGWPPLAADSLRLTLQGLPAEAAAWLSALQRSPLVWVDGGASSSSAPTASDGADASPLVLRGAKLYLRRYWACEQRVASQVLQRAGLQQPVDQPAARVWLDRLFPAASPATAAGTFDWQKFACGVALRSRLSVITGGPGTGKTYTAARLLALLFAVDGAPRRLRIGLAAPTGKAAARLKQSIDVALDELQLSLGDSLPLLELASHIGAARTLHALLGARPDTRKLRADAAHPLELDVLIVDEASMIHLEMMAALLEALPPQARVIFLGDKDQLASVEAGAVLGDLCRDAERGRYTAATAAFALAVTGQAIPAAYLADELGGAEAQALSQQTVMLRESRRFGGPIGQLALAANSGDARTATLLLRADTSPALHWLDAPTAAAVVRLALDGRAGAPGGYRSYLQVLKQRPLGADRPAFDAWVRRVLTEFERFRLLCAVREGDWGALGLNQAVERALISQGLLVKAAEWYAGRPVMVTRNDHGIGVFNGDIGIVLKPFAEAASASGSSAGLNLRAYFSDGQALRSVGVSRLADVETAFAMTVHKSQGSEFEHTVLVLPQEASRVLTRELVYTGITRARQAFTLATGWPQGFANALGTRTQRASGLLELLNAEELP